MATPFAAVQAQRRAAIWAQTCRYACAAALFGATAATGARSTAMRSITLALGTTVPNRSGHSSARAATRSVQPLASVDHRQHRQHQRPLRAVEEADELGSVRLARVVG